MNINLAAASKKKKPAAKLGFGLNQRGSNKPNNIFMAADDDSDDDDEPAAAVTAETARAAVNREIAAEQAALRKRAREKMAAAGGEYDYDGAHETSNAAQKTTTTDTTAGTGAGTARKSRYIADLLQAAEKRKQERDVVHERKVAREQTAEEEADADLAGKEKFVTAAYKRKLEERQLWLQKDQDTQREEELSDVTKKTGGAAMASFYGNWNRNVAVGGGIESSAPAEAASSGLGFLDGFEQGDGDAIGNNGSADADKLEKGATGQAAPKAHLDEVETPPSISMREARQAKLAQARMRYFQRVKLQ